MHRLLKEQLKRVGYNKEELSHSKTEELLQLVSKTYEECDQERKSLRNILKSSSKEMNSLTKLAQSEARFRALAHQDTLTGISNRFAFENDLHRLITRYSRKKKEFALLFLDLDHFKNINDTYGHDFGDKLLIQVVQRIKPKLRAEDIFARIAGDEFVIVFTDIKEEMLSVMIEKIQSLFREPWVIDKATIDVSASIGVALFPKDGNSGAQLMKNADIAMYKAKEMGRDKFSFFTEELNAKVRYEMKLEEDMFKALDNGEFELFYQPKVDARNNTIIGAEALVRWRHPELGLLAPNRFIPLCESNGFINSLGAWVIEQSSKTIQKFNMLCEKKPLSLSVNISLKQLQSPYFYKLLENTLENLKDVEFILEVTENIMIDEFEYAVHILNKIKRLGARITIDNFGKGHFSLLYLNQLPIQSIKIDKHFVDDIPKDFKNEKILLDTMIIMANTLNMSVIAEGVEENYQKEYLLKHQCFFQQGFLFSKPLSEDEYMNLLRGN